MADNSTANAVPSAPAFVLNFDIDQLALGVGATGLASPLRQLFGQATEGTQQAQAWLPDLELGAARSLLSLSSGNLGVYVSVADGDGNALASVFFFLAPDAGQDAVAVGLALDAPVDLAATPLFGGLLSGVRITDFSLSYASQQFAAGAILLPSGPDGAAAPNSEQVPAGFGLTVSVTANGSVQQLSYPAAESESESSAPAVSSSSSSSSSASAFASAETGAVARLTPAAADGTPSVTWFAVQKSLGPLFIDRIGVAAADGTLGLAIDASLTTDVVDIDLTGFTISFTPGSITSPTPSVSLDGLAVAVNAGELQISGAMGRTTGPDGGVEYDGTLLIGIGAYSINAAGSYTVVSGAPSLFVFGIAKGEFGGPPPFFVTGLAAGFGMNRALKLPAPDQVGTFPIVEAAQGSGAKDTPTALAQLAAGGWVPPALGEYWVAAGVTFRSFELINGFALLTVEFGRELVIALLGTAALALPTGSDGGATFAYVEITLEAVLRPADGEFSLEAELTPNSFLIDSSCRLTGGMAFDLWFGGNPHAGDFVLTVGGYNPLFIPPAWYPSVPRLGLTWHVSDALQVTGSCYFALTPACVMGGGLLAVTFAAGGLKAWFTAQADFLMYWRPFSYDIDVSINIGVSYTGTVGFISATFTVELGVAVRLWGPPLRGIAHVNWWVISFDIPINGGGSPQAGPGTLADWATFAKTSLPASGNVCRPRPAGDLQGVVSLPSGETIWLFSGDGLALATETLIPASQVQIAGPTASTLSGLTVGVYPLGNVAVTSVHDVCVAAWTTADWQPGQPLPVGLDVSGWGWAVTPGNLPAALWGQRAGDAAPPLSSAVVPGVVGVTGTAQATLAGGLTIGAGLLTTEEPPRGLRLPTAASGSAGSAASGDTRTQIAATIDAAAVAALRSAVVTAAGTAGLGGGPAAGSLPLLAAEVYAALTSQPMIGPPGTTGPPAPAPALMAPAVRPAAPAVADPVAAPDVTAPDVMALRALFQPASAAVADLWTSSAERRLLAPESKQEPVGSRTIKTAATMVWDLPPQASGALRYGGAAPLWIVAIDAAQRPSQIWTGRPGGHLPAGVARVAVTALATDSSRSLTAGWHGGTALRQLATQVLLGDGVVVRPQSPHGVPLHRTRGSGQRAMRELGVVTGRQLVDRTWTQAMDGGVGRGWIETWLPSWCRVVLVGLVPDPGADGAAAAAQPAGPTLHLRRWQAGQEGEVMHPVAADATETVSDAPAEAIAGRRVWQARIPDAALPAVLPAALPNEGGQVIVRAWAPAGWRLDGVYGVAAPDGWPPTTRSADSDRPEARVAGVARAADEAGLVWWA
jgi:hypothetical protein